MQNKAVHFIKYIIYAIVATVIYGVTVYFLIYKPLAGDSLVYVYIGNMVMIILALAVDGIIHGVLQSKEFVITKKNYLRARFFYMDSYVSFRTTVYMFYIVILIVSQILSLGPMLINEDLGNFILTIEYGIILVIALDTLFGAIFDDMERIRKISEKFALYLSSKQD